MLSYCIIRHHLETCFHGCFSPATSHFEGRLTVAYCATTARQMTIEIRYRCLASCCYRWLVAVRANLLSRVPGRQDERTFFISSANYRPYPEKSYTNRPSTEAYTSSGTLYLMSTKEIIPWSVKKSLGETVAVAPSLSAGHSVLEDSYQLVTTHIDRSMRDDE